ncbi:hypothetical protein PVK06_044632 [Gossypium arboreum]|uniref:Uncharacterized protein n=1 Tax=Gossypium arboreum TaxID=29729 RepID=A0ABR0MTP4_GOSAR|nr:hypothetical protein PVK06_044632 [Gossypium arboreum]
MTYETSYICPSSTLHAEIFHIQRYASCRIIIFSTLITMLPRFTSDISSSLRSLTSFYDGLARAKVSGADNADNAVGVCSDCIRCRLCIGIVSDDGSRICRWCDTHWIDYNSKLAFLQPPSTQLVGSQRS